MATYVIPLRGSIVHLGDEQGTLCGTVYRSAFYVSEQRPSDRDLCPRCEGREAARPGGDPTRAEKERDALLVSLLSQGLTDAAIRRRVHLGERTVSRYLNAAMRRSGAKTRFEWGYRTGLEHAAERGR